MTAALGSHMGLRKILVATDFSTDANAAVEHASRLALLHDADLLVLHVTGTLPPAPSAKTRPPLREMQALRRARGEDLLQELMAELATRGLKARDLFREGRAVEEIERAAEEHDVDLIVTGARGASGTQLFVIGSVAEGLVRRTHRNVLVARGEPQPFKEILIATDLTEASLAVVPLAFAFAAPAAAVELIHVVEWEDHVPSARGPQGSAAVDYKKLWDVVLEEADKELERLLAEREDGSIRHHVTDGVAASTILDRAKTNVADLLVVGKTSGDPPRHERVAERVLRHAQCPVLVARSLPQGLRVV